MDSDLLKRIQNTSLTKAQEKIARYFLKNQSRICSLSSMEAAKEIGVSDASIIRFARAIGYEGFADLKADYYQSLVESAYSGMSLTERMNQSTERYPSVELSAQYLDLMQNNLIETFHNNNPEKYQQCADLLISGATRYVIGLRGCRGVAAQFSRLLGFMLPNVHSILDGECVSINDFQDIHEGDVALMFAFARYYKMDVEYLNLAQKQGAQICLVTDELVNPLVGYASVVLQAQTEHMSFFNSSLGAVLIAEYLLTLISRKIDFRERIQKRDRITECQRL